MGGAGGVEGKEEARILEVLLSVDKRLKSMRPAKNNLSAK